MPVIGVREIWAGRNGSADDKGVREYTRVFRVETNNAGDGPLTVRAGTGIPLLFSAYADANGAADPGAKLKRLSEEQDADNPYLWTVTCEYSSRLENPDEFHENPLLRPSEIRWSSAKYQKPVTEDVLGFPVQNSAKDPFDPPPEIDDTRIQLEITRNEAAFTPALALDFQDKTNNDVFFGAAPGIVKCDSIEADSQYENGLVFWRVTYRFSFRFDGWTLALLDQGFRQLTGGQKKEILDDEGKRISAPWPLHPDGSRMASSGTPLFREFTVYQSRNFASLGLP
jgi:hypothetical protein